MATVAHCLYCFEVLSASLGKRDHLSLPQVEDLWARFQTREQDALKKETLHDESNNLDHDPEHGEDEDLMSEPDEGQEDLLAGEEEPQAAEPATNKSTLQLPSISRLQASPSSASASSTPSSISASSSRLRLDDSSSKTSSSTSIFSFGHRSQQPSPVVKDDRYPLFVTWNTFPGRGHKSLRGCIGTFEPQELSSGLKNYALTARRLGATYLPDVAVEQGWTKEETMVSLMRKAGWTGRSREWRTIGDLRAIRYEGEGADCRWNIWREWRDWVDRIGEASKDK
ncbi:MAG: hypothetical protein Q9203_006252 [Teloschistes exilis]